MSWKVPDSEVTGPSKRDQAIGTWQKEAAGSRQQGVDNREQTTGSTRQGVDSMEQISESRQEGIGNEGQGHRNMAKDKRDVVKVVCVYVCVCACVCVCV